MSIFKDLIFTPQCILCKVLGNEVCPTCLNQVSPFIARPLIGLAGLYCASEYSGWVRDSLISYKNGDKSVAPALSHILVYALEASPINLPFVMVPIPSSIEKINERKYDSIANLCHEMNRLKRNLRVDGKSLYLRRRVQDQVGLSARERHLNLADAFAMRRRLSGNVLIVDDVVTTGATLTNAAKALRIAGAQRIFALTLCGSTKKM